LLNKYKKLKEEEAKRQQAADLQIEYKEPDEEEEKDEVPMITVEMLMAALKEAKRSVSPAEYQKYLEMKLQFDREAGIIPEQGGGMQGGGFGGGQFGGGFNQQPSFQAPSNNNMNNNNNNNNAAPSQPSNAQPINLTDDENIYN